MSYRYATPQANGPHTSYFERGVLLGICAGLTYRTIARCMDSTCMSIHTTVQRLLNKHGMADRRELALQLNCPMREAFYGPSETPGVSGLATSSPVGVSGPQILNSPSMHAALLQHLHDTRDTPHRRLL